MKKMLLLLIAIATCNSASHAQVYGDVNGDGVVTVADVTEIYNILLGNVPYVDLGLPSGTLWAKMNVGASSPEDYGDYFAWGETQPKEVYNWSTYAWCNGSSTKITKYCTNNSFGNNGFVDNKTELDLADDAAYVNWGPGWRMPSLDQIQELINECDWQRTTMNGVNGCLVTSKHNGASLFLPAAGWRWDGMLDGTGENGRFWSRTLDASSPSNAYLLGFGSDDVVWEYNSRAIGRAIRAVVRVSQN